MKTRMVWCLWFGGSFALFVGGPVGAAEPPRPSARVQQQIQALHDEKASRSPTLRKLDSQLVYALRQMRQPAIAPGVDALKPALRFEPGGQTLLVDLRATVTPELLASIVRGGGVVLNSFPRYRAIRARLSLELIEALAARPDVAYIRPADEATTNSGPITSEGDITHQAQLARSAFQISGAGVRVGVLSDSVDYLSLSVTNGELPIVRILPGQAGSGSGEGTAMLEIVHDLAPDAELYFATAFSGVASFAQNIRDLYAAGCRVIVDDVTYFNESPFQDGPISQAVNEVTAGGALFFSSAGNSGNKNDNTSGTWEGDFLDGGPATIGRSGRLHDFGGVVFNTLQPAGGFRRVDLFWADPLGASANDYDVYVLNPDDSVASGSANVQDGDDDPYEAIPFLSPGQRIVIVKYSGEGRYLHLSSGRGVLAVSTPGATRGHNASGASNAFCVAATWVGSPAVPFVGGNANPVELFSSDGPRKMFFNPDGSAITPGNFSATGGVTLQKPDVTAADGVSTSVPLFGSFFGTSASAPHAAAIAALLWSYHPGLTPAEVRSTFAASALDIEEPGVDRDSGIGIVMAPEALNAAPPPLPRLLFESALLTGGNGNGNIDANECGDLFIALQNLISASGQTATGVTAVLTAITPGVLVDPTPQFFPEIPPGASGVSLSPFRISVAPDYPCGSPAVFELSVTASNSSGSRLSFELPSTPPGVDSPLSFVATDVPLIVPDLGTVESAVVVTNVALPVAKVSVKLHVSHTYDSDLQISLLGPDGTTVDLSSNNGGSGANYGTSCSALTVFDEFASNSIVSGTAPFVGAFRPEQSLAVFNGKTGTAANGTWRLRVHDAAQFDSGVLECWTLEVSPILCPEDDGQCLFPPHIASQPQSLLATNGNTVRLSVGAEGSPPLRFQWYFNTTNALAGATNSDLVLAGVTPEQTGRYSVEVSNPYGTVRSAEAELLVVLPPQIISSPQDQITTNGLAAAFSVIAVGTAPLHFQWMFNETNPIAGATNSTLLLGAVTPTQAGRYSVVVSNAYGLAVSSAATLTVLVRPFITQQPQDRAVSDGGSAVFTVVAGGTEPLDFQWYYNETNLLAGATNTSLMLDNITTNQAGGYSVVVANAYGTITSVEAELTVVESNEPPTVVLTAPADGSVFLVSSSLFLTASAADPDGTIVNVRFLADERELGQAYTAPYQFEWQDPNIGPHDLRAVATDGENASTTSAVVRVTVNLSTNATQLVSTGSVWKYLDTGVAQGAAWRALDFNDSAWASGPAQLGYGDNDEATVVSFGPSSTNKFITTYFRRRFFLTDAPSFTNLQLRLLRDDGAVVYLNETEVFRSNMPTGSIAFSTRALNVVNGAAERSFFTTNVLPSLLRSGTNIVAVEVHQVDPTSSDLSFVVELTGRRSFGPRIITSPQSQEVPDGSTVTLNVTAVGGEPLDYQWYFNSTNVLAGATNTALVLQNVTTNQSGLYSVVVSNAFGTVSSTGAVLTVFPFEAPPSVSLLSPTNAAVFALGEPILLEASASDLDGSVVQVEFFADAASLGSAAAAPFRFEWLDANSGVHTLLAVATDNEGARATSALAQITINFSTNRARLIAAGAIWKFLDNGTDQGESWRTPGFDDHTWASGPAQLGYGDGDEATVIASGPTTNRFITSYFRRAFALTDAASLTNTLLRVLRDDGAVVYLNGIEVFRSNMPTGTVFFTTPASTAVGGAEESAFFESAIPVELLHNGTNVVAVEVHQAGPTSSDVSFALELLAERLSVPVIVAAPTNQIVSLGSTANFAVSALGTLPLSYQWLFNGTNVLLGKTDSLLVLSNVTTDLEGNYSVLVSNALGSVLSPEAALSVTLANDPPMVTLVNPGDGGVFEANVEPILLEASASDSDGLIAHVEFFADGTRLGEDNAVPYRFEWLDPRAGMHRLEAVAFDEHGATGTSAPVRIIVSVSTNVARLIPAGSLWKYLDTGTNAGTSWRAVEFDDSAWASGPAELGYGDDVEGRPEATVVSFGPESTNKYVTTYFRRAFVLTDAASFSDPFLRLLRDDGAVVYLNDVEVFRSNMPTGNISFATFAAAVVGGADETNYFDSPINAALLRDGTNVIAVEVHQADATSSDVSFDLELLANRFFAPAIVLQPESQTVTNGATVTLAVAAIGAEPLNYQWFFNTTNALAAGNGSTLVLGNVTTNDAGGYFAVVSNAYGATTSALAQLTVLVPGSVPPMVAWVQPSDEDRFDVGDPIHLEAVASDPDGVVTRVSFHADGVALGEDASSPFEFDWLNATVGVHLLTAVALDNFGATATSAVVRIVVTPPVTTPEMLISTGAVWHYLDTGVDPGATWRDVGFDDSAWGSGPAELGYGDDVEGRPEATVIEFGSDPRRKHITYYFRHSFVVTNRDLIQQLEARLLRDDGAVVYLNGVEIFRSNMPVGEINSETRATGAVSRDEEFQFFAQSVDPGLLLDGTNVIAVEVHQVNQTSSDLSFDFALPALKLNPPAIVIPPQDQTVMEGETATFNLVAAGLGLLTYQWFFNETNSLSGETNETLVLPNVSTNQAGSYRVGVSNAAGVTFSAPALLTVVTPPPNEPPIVLLSSPTNGAVFLETAVIPLAARAEDSDGQVVVVEFFDGPTKIGQATNSPFVLDWIGATVGPHELSAVATDERGASNTSSPVEIFVVQQLPSPDLQVSLIQTGSVWRYLDTGLDQGTSWVSATFNDSAWAAGPGELGYGDAADGRPEATGISFGPDPGNKFPTYYFRHNFNATNIAALTALKMRLLRDDGVVVYLNGSEVFRDNLPPGPIGFTNLALVEIGKEGETDFLDVDLSPAGLADGSNIVAVEIHQVSPSDADVSFDLELIALQPAAPVILEQPQNQVVARGGTAQFGVRAAGIEPLLYQWFLNGLIALPGATNSTLLVTNAQTTSEGSYSVEVSNAVAAARSSSAILTVLDSPRILVQPQNATVPLGGAAEFNVTATGAEPLSYQWVLNGTNILAGATNRMLSLAGVSAADSGSYAVVVTNLVGSATSQAALLRVLLPSQVVQFTHTPTLVTLSFATAANLRYTVEYTPDFNVWALLPGAVKLFGTGDLITVTDDAVGIPQRFYRIRIE